MVILMAAFAAVALVALVLLKARGSDMTIHIGGRGLTRIISFLRGVTPPTETGAPSITSADLNVGTTATATRGTYTGTVTGYNGQWYRGSSPIALATALTYRFQAADVGNNITYQEYAYNVSPRFSSAVGTSNALGPIVSTAPTKTGNPSISGSPVVGQVLTATHGTYTGTVTGYNQQWYSGASAISGATSLTYTAQNSDVGNNITYQESAYNGSTSNSSATGTSNALGPVTSSSGVPTISVNPAALTGDSIVGQKLYVNDLGTWTGSPTSYVINWYDENGLITNVVEQGLSYTATGQAYYAIYDTEVGHTIQAGISAVNSYGTSSEVKTPFTSAVTAINLAGDAPAITWISGTSDFDVDVAFGSNTYDSGNYYEHLQIATDYGFGFLAGATISSITIDSTGAVATVTTATPHGLSVSPPEQVTIAGAVPSAFNISGANLVTVPSSTTFTYYIPNAAALLSATGSSSGGTLAAGTYYYKIAAIISGAEQLPSNELSVTTTGSASSVALTWNAYPGATAYKIYRGTAAGAENVYYAPAGTGTSYTDTGAASTAGTPITAATTVGTLTYSSIVYDGTRQIVYGDFATPYNADWTKASPPLSDTTAYKIANGTFWQRRQVYAETPAYAQVTSPWSNVLNNSGAGPPLIWNSSDMSPFSGGNGPTLTNNNRTVTMTGQAIYGIRATQALPAIKGYFEFHIDNTTGNRHIALVAGTEPLGSYWWDSHSGSLTFTMGIFNDVKLEGTSVGWTSTLGGVATVGIAFDFTTSTKKVWMGIDNGTSMVWQHSSSPTGGTGYVDISAIGSTNIYPAVQGNSGAAVTAAFKSTDMLRSPPSGFSALS